MAITGYACDGCGKTLSAAEGDLNYFADPASGMAPAGALTWSSEQHFELTHVCRGCYDAVKALLGTRRASRAS